MRINIIFASRLTLYSHLRSTQGIMRDEGVLSLTWVDFGRSHRQRKGNRESNIEGTMARKHTIQGSSGPMLGCCQLKIVSACEHEVTNAVDTRKVTSAFSSTRPRWKTSNTVGEEDRRTVEG